MLWSLSLPHVVSQYDVLEIQQYLHIANENATCGIFAVSLRRLSPSEVVVVLTYTWILKPKDVGCSFVHLSSHTSEIRYKRESVTTSH